MKVYSVQEIWGDGDGWPTLTSLKLFATKKLAENYCNETWEKTLVGNDEIISKKQELRIVNDSDDAVFDCRYGKFCAFLLKEIEVEE